MSEEPKLVEVRFLQTILSGGREVWLGYNTEDDKDRSVFMRFKSEDGEETKLRLSEEAFAALVRLKHDVEIFRDTKTVMRWRAVVDLSDPDKPETVINPESP